MKDDEIVSCFDFIQFEFISMPAFVDQPSSFVQCCVGICSKNDVLLQRDRLQCLTSRWYCLA